MNKYRKRLEILTGAQFNSSISGNETKWWEITRLIERTRKKILLDEGYSLMAAEFCFFIWY